MQKLFLSDFDGTLVSKDILDVVCGIVGKEKESERLNEEIISGRQNGLHILKSRIDFLRGVTLEQIKSKLDDNNYLLDGAKELFAYLKANGFTTVLHTGNILPVAEYYQNLLGVDYVVCTKPRMNGNKIVGIELKDFGKPGFKAKGCKEIIDKFDISKENIYAIGDSIVDLSVFELAGTCIAINAKGGIEKHADIVLKSGTLTELIPYLKTDTTKADWYKKHADMDAEKDFHRRRTTFMIIDGEMRFLQNSEMSHYSWAMSLGIKDENFNKLVRGYYLDGRAVFYKGNFIYDDECIEHAKIFAPKVKEFVKADTMEIWCGQTVGKIGEFWPPTFYIGKI